LLIAVARPKDIMNPVPPAPLLDAHSPEGFPPAGTTEHAVATPSSVWRLRTDSWDFLAYTRLLSAATGNGAPATGLMAEPVRLLNILDSIEPYFACPGVG
jgi:hypothetical protein